jgi:hypothetical protein
VLRSQSVVLAPILVLALGTGCSGDGGPPTPTPAVTPPVTADPQATDDQAGMLACDALSASMVNGTLMEPGVADSIVTSAGSADGPIADAAQRLRAAYNSAIAARGTGGEPDAVAAVSVAGSDMLNVCDDSGLRTVG